MNQADANTLEKEKNPRNSKLRDLVATPVRRTVEFLDEKAPWLTPNMITVLGTTGILALSIYTASLEKKGKIDSKTSIKLLTAFLVLSITDALDGGLARLKIAKGQAHNPESGQLIDTISDRMQEAFSEWLLMYRANENGDIAGMTAALATALTNPLSSLFRAWAEAEGVVVPESGKSLFDLFGTRVGKVIASSVKFMPYKKVGGVSIQSGIDMMVAAATIKVAIGRLNAVLQATKVKDDGSSLDLDSAGKDEEVEVLGIETTEKGKILKLKVDGQNRRVWLGGALALTTAVSLALFHYLRKNGNKEAI
ncbi:CDP-alcohol phosphatidyltransferase family protein [Candidatus Woesebacteria bacterium]|nr:CDP-alcohol phosphatidyltransferase family protein [Candidatus Woesebacteria bacterium]